SLAEVYPDINVLGLPFLFRNLDEVDYLRSQLDPVLRKGLEDAGFVNFGFAEGGFAKVMSTRPIRKTTDLNNEKAWVPDNDKISYRVMSALGVSPVRMPITDVLTGLQTGLISAGRHRLPEAHAHQVQDRRTADLSRRPVRDRQARLRQAVGSRPEGRSRSDGSDLRAPRQGEPRGQRARPPGAAAAGRGIREGGAGCDPAVARHGRARQPRAGEGRHVLRGDHGPRLSPAGRVPQRQGSAVTRLVHWLRALEDALLIVAFGSLVVLAGLQIVMRNIFESGFVWIDPLLRILVLWVGMLG